MYYNKNYTGLNGGLGEWSCTECTQRTTFKEVVDGLFKIAVIGGVGYMLFTYRSQIKEAVTEATKRLKK